MIRLAPYALLHRIHDEIQCVLVFACAHHHALYSGLEEVGRLLSSSIRCFGFQSLQD